MLGGFGHWDASQNPPAQVMMPRKESGGTRGCSANPNSNLISDYNLFFSICPQISVAVNQYEILRVCHTNGLSPKSSTFP